MNEQRAREAVEHLQTAALEVIASLRAFLDVAEDLVRDPAKVSGVVNDLADIGRRAAGSPPTGDDPGVTRIRVS